MIPDSFESGDGTFALQVTKAERWVSAYIFDALLQFLFKHKTMRVICW